MLDLVTWYCMKVVLMLSHLEWIAEEGRIDCWPETEINRRWYGGLKFCFVVKKFIIGLVVWMLWIGQKELGLPAYLYNICVKWNF